MAIKTSAASGSVKCKCRCKCGSDSKHGQNTFSLAQAAAGKSYRVFAVKGGHAVQMRLASMGILPGQVIRVERANAVGPVLISAKAAKLALGQGVSHKLILTDEADDIACAPADEKTTESCKQTVQY